MCYSQNLFFYKNVYGYNIREDSKQKQRSDNDRNERGATLGKIATLVTSGAGSTKDEATKNALRRAIEQTYGTFVSANSQVVNDELIKDEIVTVSSGNIIGYDIISTNDNRNGVEVTLKAVVSPEKLVSFAKSKGMKTELAGATFAMNIKMKQLNKKNEEIALKEMRSRLIEICKQGIFDYELVTGEPKMSKDGVNFELPLKVYIKKNKNTRKFYDYLYKTLSALSLSKQEHQDYLKTEYPFYIFDKDMFQILPSFWPHYRWGMGNHRRQCAVIEDLSYREYFSDMFYLRSLVLDSLNVQGILLSAIKMFQIKDNLDNVLKYSGTSIKSSLPMNNFSGLIDGNHRKPEEDIRRDPHSSGYLSYKDEVGGHSTPYLDYILWMLNLNRTDYRDWTYESKGIHFNNIPDYYKEGHLPEYAWPLEKPNRLYEFSLSLQYTPEQMSNLSGITIEPTCELPDMN
jgi:hypothetical protein